MQVVVRPENLRVAPLTPGAALGPRVVPGKIADLTFLGNLVDCHVTLGDGTRIRVQVDPGLRLEVGLPVERPDRRGDCSLCGGPQYGPPPPAFGAPRLSPGRSSGTRFVWEV